MAVEKNFIVYRSSAGSGKTSTLVQQYLALALQDDNPFLFRHILALTFTNKAAGEMKERIIGTLKKLAKGQDMDGHMSKGLQEKLEIDSDTLSGRAGKVLTTMLHNYSDLAVGTIDQFVYRIIRTFARDLRIAMDFDVEMDTQQVNRQIVEDLLSTIGLEDFNTKMLLAFAYQKMQEDKSWNLDKDLLEIGDILYKDQQHEQLKSLAQIPQKSYKDGIQYARKAISDFESHVLQLGKAGLNVLRTHGAEIEDFYQGKKGIGNYFLKLSEGSMKALAPNSLVQKTISEDKWYGGKATEAQKVVVDACRDELIDIYAEVQELEQNKYPQYLLRKEILRRIHTQALLGEMARLLDNYKKEQNKVLISDFNLEIAKVVQEEPAPFIYERLGERYRYFLIDEFQDTSILQWHNLLPLIENALGSGNRNLVVGDAKQAIYRFRGGESEQFVQLPGRINESQNPLLNERVQALGLSFEEKALDTNFRSAQQIVDFNNKLFELLKEKLPDELKGVYSESAQRTGSKDELGYVDLEFLPKENNKELGLNKVLEQVRAAKTAGYSYRSIAVLCIKNTLGSDIAQHLLAHDIPVVTSDSLLVANSEQVELIENMLRAVYQPELYAPAVRLIWHLEGPENAHAALLKFQKRSASKEKAIDLRSFLRGKVSAFSWQEIRQMALFPAVEYLISVFKLEANAQVLAFLDLVHQFSAGQSTNVKEFLEWWDQQKSKKSIVAPESSDAVKIMTIHKSKGLQFPVVILPFVSWQARNTVKDAWVDLKDEFPPLSKALVGISRLKGTAFEYLKTDEESKALLDALNLLYVAFTRAEERLYIHSLEQPKKENRQSISMDKLLAEAATQLPWDTAETPHYTIGLPNLKTEKLGDSGPSWKLSRTGTSDWSDKIRISPAGSGGLIAKDADPQKYGSLLHLALANMEVLEDAERAVSQLVESDEISEEEQKRLSGDLKKLSEVEAIKNWFAPGIIVKREAELISKDGQILRPDRVVLNGSAAVIIDFKTGAENPKHMEQVNSYAGALEEMGFRKIERNLFYTATQKVLSW